MRIEGAGGTGGGASPVSARRENVWSLAPNRRERGGRNVDVLLIEQKHASRVWKGGD